MGDVAAQAVAAKNRGNAAFSAKNYVEAIAAFTEAIVLEPSNHVYFSNRSASYCAMNKYDEAVEDGRKCVELSPAFAKGYARVGAALFCLNKFEEAVEVYQQGLAAAGDDKALTEGLTLAQQKVDDKVKSESDKKDKAADDLKKQNEVIIGIDLGTTYSCVGVWRGGGVEIIANEWGDRTTPSYVAFVEDGGRLVGAAAKNQENTNPKRTLFDVKRIIGQRFSDAGVEADVRRFPFPVKAVDGDKPLIRVDIDEKTSIELMPEQVSAMVLEYMKKTAETYLGHPITKAVVTVPAYFSDAQRMATKAAGAIAGLDVQRIINEPTAAALAYGLDKKADSGSSVLIFDLGGGTFDVSMLKIADGIIEVLATAGDTHLGGEDFDNEVVDFLLKESKRMGFPDAAGNEKALRRMKTSAERAKRMLSDAVHTQIQIDSWLDGKDFEYQLTRAKFEALNKKFFTRCLDTVKRVLKDANLKVTDVDDVVLVGGSTRIPKVQEMLSEYFKGKELCKTLNPDEAVAYGAAVQGAILSGVRNEQTQMMLLMDVTPLSLGIETVGRVMSTIIKRNTAIPCRKTQVYTTEENYQTAVDVCVYEGERQCVDGNNLLGKFTITGIERAKRGEPQIEVSFDLDANGILTVTARDTNTGARADIEIANRNQTSNDDVQRMVAEAEKYRAADEMRMAKVDARNELEQMVFTVLEIAEKEKDKKMGAILEKAAHAAGDWLEENGEKADLKDIKEKKRELERRIRNRVEA